MQTTGEARGKSTPRGCHDEAIADGDEDVQQLEELLEEFYAFMYEKAVLVGPTGTSPVKLKSTSKTKGGTGSPTRGSSPTHDAHNKQVVGGPSTSNVPVSGALSREVMDALLPPK
ncbi:hypothetical protein PHYPSEUDO_008298 [Phytophthora pseudosyringae]|uniref:Uncharacterized protein n=1 Tax=Phytophthora pseudosyringae TaxID=221518 RepID=A0A8T1VHP4_9STRA|nr:hypothetical protein PHYPSEUDO_008298 [Phytophthora pseudosyringae]